MHETKRRAGLHLMIAGIVAAGSACSLATDFEGYHTTSDAGDGMDAAGPDGGVGDGGRRDAPPPRDGGGPDAAETCGIPSDCDDGVFCNGAERCAPGDPGADARGCLPPDAPRCVEGATCEEDSDRCLTDCDRDADADDDGVDAVECGGTDCDDSTPTTFPGATEECNGADDDCDTMTDEGLLITYYRDADRDGYGLETDTTMACGRPAGYADRAGDCDDTAGATNPEAAEVCNGADDDCDTVIDEGVLLTFYADGDADGHGDRTMPMTACAPPVGYVASSDDCDDMNGDVYSGATEVCNGVDDDCDMLTDEGVTSTWYRDGDGDGYGVTTMTRVGCAMGGWSSMAGDCNDMDASIRPGRPETCDMIDQDCDGRTDEGLCTWACIPGPTASCALPAQVAAGAVFHCVLLDSGAVYCVGDNARGQLGSTGASTASYRAVSGLPTFVTEIAAGGRHACVLRTNGEVWCWGDNTEGQLGNGTTIGSTVPVRVSLPVGVMASGITAGDTHSCALAGTRIHCWGSNIDGQLGMGSTGGRRTSPVEVALTISQLANAVSAGSRHTCALVNGLAMCWGHNLSGQLGRGSAGSSSGTPMFVTPAPSGTPLAVSAGNDYTCVATTGPTHCWGDNAFGQLGDGTTVDRYAPAMVSGTDLMQLTRIEAGDRTTCGAAAGVGQGYCWGDGTEGVLGNGTTTSSPTPAVVAGIPNVHHVAGAGRFMCAMSTTQAVRCWGSNASGQLGDGTTTRRLVPTAVVGPGA